MATLRNLLAQGCPPKTVGTILLSRRADYLFTLQIGVYNVGAFLRDSDDQLEYLPCWHIPTIVRNSMLQEGLNNDGQRHRSLYDAEYSRRLRVIRNAQSKVFTELLALGETAIGLTRDTVARDAYLEAELGRIGDLRRQQLVAGGMEFVLNLDDMGRVKVDDRRRRRFRGRKQIPERRWSGAKFAPELEAAAGTVAAAEAMIDLSTHNGLRMLNVAAGEVAQTRSNFIDLTEDMGSNFAVRQRDFDSTTTNLADQEHYYDMEPDTTSGHKGPSKRQTRQSARELFAVKDQTASVIAEDDDGSLYDPGSDEDNDDDESPREGSLKGTDKEQDVADEDSEREESLHTETCEDPRSESPDPDDQTQHLSSPTDNLHPAPSPTELSLVPPPYQRRQRQQEQQQQQQPINQDQDQNQDLNQDERPASPIFYPGKPIRPESIIEIESDYPFLRQIPNQSSRYDWYHFLTFFGRNPALRRSVNAWFDRNGEDAIRLEARFLRAIQEQCLRLRPVRGEEDGEVRYVWQD